MLYHVTHRKNLASIKKLGVSPEFAKGKIPAVYVCRGSSLGWAVQHTIARHGWSAKSIAIVAVATPGLKGQRTGTPGVFRYYVALKMEKVL